MAYKKLLAIFANWHKVRYSKNTDTKNRQNKGMLALKGAPPPKTLGSLGGLGNTRWDRRVGVLARLRIAGTGYGEWSSTGARFPIKLLGCTTKNGSYPIAGGSNPPMSTNF